MADVHKPEIRSFNMSQIKGKNTKPEILVRKFLFRNGFRYRLNDKKLPGKPDIVLKKYNTVIFVDGCFWHGHKGCKYYVIPKTRTDFWLKKIETNITNDKKKRLQLKKMGWKIINLWECDLSKNKSEKTFKKLIENLK